MLGTQNSHMLWKKRSKVGKVKLPALSDPKMQVLPWRLRAAQSPMSSPALTRGAPPPSRKAPPLD